MLFTLIHWTVSAFAMMLTAYLVRGFKIRSFTSALFACFVIGIADVLVRPILLFLTFPLNILTLGLFTFVVNGIVIKLCAAVVPGFEVEGWGAAIFGALVLAIVGTGLHYLLV
jgi:putative membrane protein